MKFYNLNYLFCKLPKVKLIKVGIVSICLGTTMIGCGNQEEPKEIVAPIKSTLPTIEIETIISESSSSNIGVTEVSTQTIIEDVPEIPELFESPEDLVTFVDESTTLIRDRVNKNTLENDENMKRAFQILIKTLEFRYLEKEFSGIYYNDLTEEQKQTFDNRSSIVYSWLKMNVQNFSQSLDNAFNEYYGTEAETKKTELNQIINNLNQLGNEFVEEQKEQWHYDKENAKEIIDIFKDVWQKQKQR